MNRESLTHPFGPLYDSESRVLILGSFPSVKSREMDFYYMHPQNRFWPVLSRLFDEEITDRRQFCLDHHIALWDVIESCSIVGSGDTSIKDVKVNEIASLCSQTKIRAVFTTGKKASDLYRRYVTCDLPHIPLPSTSPANAAMKLDRLTEEYRIIKEYLL